MACEVIVRLATPQDLEKRRELVRNFSSTGFLDAFLFFFFQELTLEICVLSGAVLFIFCGVSVSGCFALLPGAAVIVTMAVLLQQYTLAQKHSESIYGEMFGVVAEAHGSLLPPAHSVPIRLKLHESLNEKDESSLYAHIVGTVSVSDFQGGAHSGWLHALTVHPQWRRRGIGLALVGGARRSCAGRGLQSLECAISHLQPAVRQLLHAAGWECRGSYERRVVSTALTLPMLRLGTDLPLA